MGGRVDAVTLVSHMVEAFMARDRAFKKTGEKLNVLPAPTKAPPAA